MNKINHDCSRYILFTLHCVRENIFPSRLGYLYYQRKGQKSMRAQRKPVQRILSLQRFVGQYLYGSQECKSSLKNRIAFSEFEINYRSMYISSVWYNIIFRLTNSVGVLLFTNLIPCVAFVTHKATRTSRVDQNGY